MLQRHPYKLSRPVMPGVFSVTLPLLGDKPGPVNVYLFKGRDNITLLDSGTSKAFGVLKNALSEHGLACDDIDRIVLTHSHIDHYGAVRKILRAASYPIDVAGNFIKTASIATGLGVSKKTMNAFLSLRLFPKIRKTVSQSSSCFSQTH